MLLLLISVVSCMLLPSMPCAQDLLQCYVQGECPHASLLPPTTAESYNECLAKCQGDAECQWFTFYPDAHFCKLMKSCPEGPTAECQEEPCFSSEAQCKQVLQCDVSSLWCEDPDVGFWIHVENLQECKDRCYEEQLCQWYNFDASTQACSLTPSCESSTATCSTCVAGQRECMDAGPEMNRLMVVGGFPNDEFGVEVIDLTGNNLTCRQLRNGPFDYGAVGHFVANSGRPIVCAGKNDGRHCYTHNNQTDAWAVVPVSLAHAAHNRGRVALTDGRWWLAGGRYSNDEVQSQTEIVIPDNGTSEPFAALPRSTSSPMLLQLNESAVIFVGGWDSHEDCWLFNLDSEEWTQMPNMPIARTGPAAGLATFPDGTRQLVVTGGGDNTTHGFNFDTNAWRLIPGQIPYDLFIPSSVQFRDTFLLIGGRVGEFSITQVNTILEFDPVNEAWIVREETLKEAKFLLAAFLIPDDYVECV